MRESAALNRMSKDYNISWNRHVNVKMAVVIEKREQASAPGGVGEKTYGSSESAAKIPSIVMSRSDTTLPGHF